MSSLKTFAQQKPDTPAVIIAETGEQVSFGSLHARSARLAQHLAERLPQGGVIAILLGNRLEYLEVCFAARRAGLYYVPISTHLTAAEVAYILRDAAATCLVTEKAHADIVRAFEPALRSGLTVLSVDQAADAGLQGEQGKKDCQDYKDYQDIVNTGPVPELPQRAMGVDFAYSSGTTGKPKGIKHALTGDPQISASMQPANWTSFFDLGPDSVYLSPAPMYHAAPLRFSIRCLASGGTVVIMRKFDAQRALAFIERYRITHSQWVPTMFVRFLALAEDERCRYDLSSHRMALHAAAPCPIDVKRRMIDWWGPIVWEYYSGSERAGATVISPQEWLAHPGSVGKAVQGRLHIVNDEGADCPAGVDGLVCFEGGPRFRYHNDEAKTAEAHTPQGWATMGDIGHVDTQDYLYLTDRRANMIISGGVNIYPQEAENLLLEHPLVLDVAVIGVPHADYGEEVKAVVELRDPHNASDATAQALLAFCRDRLSHIKCPRSIDFATGLPRTDTGKLLKRLVRDQYRARQAPPERPHPQR